jgi:hypothetical protein
MGQQAMRAGHTVWIVNTTIGGRYIVEGAARLMKRSDPKDDRMWRVQFLRDDDEPGDVVERYVMHDARDQELVRHYVKRMNEGQS